jgi:hypothetical protein
MPIEVKECEAGCEEAWLPGSVRAAAAMQAEATTTTPAAARADREKDRDI